MLPAPPSAADLRPLAARSVVLSLVLGSHPRGLGPGTLIRAGEHFGIAPSTVRVALTRAVAAGDLHRDGRDYRLGDRLVVRQRRQDEAVDAAETSWDGAWEMAVVTVTGRPGAERAALRELLGAARLAELRDGVWTRPANLRRPAPYADHPSLSGFRSHPIGDPAVLASSLWDLAAWSDRGHLLLRLLHASREPSARLAAAAHLVRHLATDPLLPRRLLPPSWPGATLRQTYADYQAELRDLAEGCDLHG